MNYFYAALIGMVAGITTGYLVHIANAAQSYAVADDYITALCAVAYLMGMIAGIFITMLAKCMVELRYR